MLTNIKAGKKSNRFLQVSHFFTNFANHVRRYPLCVRLATKQPMIIDIKTKKDRQEEDKKPSDKGCGGSQGSDQESMFHSVLKSALKSCKLAKSYEEALPQWHLLISSVMKMGCPFELVEKYENQLKSHFLKIRKEETKRYIDIFNDNHGNINH